MAEPSRARKLTYEEFLRFPDDGRRHELIDGEHFVSPAPFVPHQRILMRLSVTIGSFLDRHPHLGEILAAPTDVVLSHHDVVEPDLLFVSAARAGQVGERNVQGPPDLVVEILSRSTRRLDLGRKLRLYERSGVAEYWLVDPDAEAVTVFRHEGDALKRVADLTRATSDPLASPLFPGLAIGLDEIFRTPGGA